jgi:MFS family permease
MIVEKRFLPLYIGLFSIFALFGISMTVIGATLPKIFADFGWSYTTAGAVIAAGSIGYFLSSYLAGIFLSAVGLRLTISLSLLLVFAGLEFFAATSIPWLNMLLYFIVGIGQGGIELSVDWANAPHGRAGGGRAMSSCTAHFDRRRRGATHHRDPDQRASAVDTDLGESGIVLGHRQYLCNSCPSPPSQGQGTRAGQVERDLFRHPLTGSVSLRSLSMWASKSASRTGRGYFVSVFNTPIPTGSFMVSLFWAGLLVGRFGVPSFRLP